MLMAMIIGSLLAAALGTDAHNIALVGSIPASLPPLSVPDFSPQLLNQLGSGALAIGLLGLVEAVSIARSVASRSHQNISGNQEFMGQALSNIVGSFFSCYASSGSFTSTGVNYTSGARTPLAAVFAALALAIIVLLLSDLTAYVPIPSMAGILLMVSWNLVDFHHIRGIIKAGHSEALVLIVTFLATLVMAMEFAIYVGVMLSLVFYLKTTSRPKIVQVLPDPTSPSPFFLSNESRNLPECSQLHIIRIEGSLFFGAVNYVKEYLQDIQTDNVLIVGNGMNFIDIAGAELLVQEARRRRSAGGTLYFCNLKDRVSEYLDKNGHIGELGAENIFISKGIAVAQIHERLDRTICNSCNTRIFAECGRHRA